MDFSKMSCQEISIWLEQQRNSAISDEICNLLLADSRKNVVALAKQRMRNRQKQEAEQQRLDKLYDYERKLQARGYALIAGIDEAGRGPLAGPVIAAAVILPSNLFLAGLNDSKKVSAKRREQLYEEIQEKAIAVGVGRAEVGEIDRLNILQANYLAMQRAVADLTKRPDYLLIDGNGAPRFSLPYLPVIGGDRVSASIAAASIIAKVTRDREMLVLDRQYPDYQFAKHKGYGTELHVQALEKYGVSPIHRRSFSLVARYQVR